MMATIRDITLEKAKQSKRFEGFRRLTKCVTIGVDSSQSPSVTGRNGYVWCREYGLSSGAFQAFNPGAQLRVGIPVIVGDELHDPFRRVIIGFDWGTLETFLPEGEDPGDYNSGNHHRSHEWPDQNPQPDAVSIYQRALVPLRAMPNGADMIIQVAPAVIHWNGVFTRYNGDTIDLSANTPSAGNVDRVLVYLDMTSTPTLTAVAAGEVASGSDPGWPDPPSKSIPIVWVDIADTDTSLDETDMTDARPIVVYHVDYDTIIQNIVKQIAALGGEIDVIMTAHMTGGFL